MLQGKKLRTQMQYFHPFQKSDEEHVPFLTTPATKMIVSVHSEISLTTGCANKKLSNLRTYG
jgi:hypothetical protein